LLDLSHGHEDNVFDRSIDVQILRLRRKLEIDPSRPIDQDGARGGIFSQCQGGGGGMTVGM
jgi:two-component system OmpR family response regulator